MSPYRFFTWLLLGIVIGFLIIIVTGCASPTSPSNNDPLTRYVWKGTLILTPDLPAPQTGPVTVAATWTFTQTSPTTYTSTLTLGHPVLPRTLSPVVTLDPSTANPIRMLAHTTLPTCALPFTVDASLSPTMIFGTVRVIDCTRTTYTGRLVVEH